IKCVIAEDITIWFVHVWNLFGYDHPNLIFPVFLSWDLVSAIGLIRQLDQLDIRLIGQVIAEEPLEIEKTLDLSRFLQNAVRNNRDNNQELESKMNKQINLKAFNKEEDYNLAELAAMFLK
ncbi:17585_t:CDS:2, partial [Funneliformis geosporum]